MVSGHAKLSAARSSKCHIGSDCWGLVLKATLSADIKGGDWGGELVPFEIQSYFCLQKVFIPGQTEVL